MNYAGEGKPICMNFWTILLGFTKVCQYVPQQIDQNLFFLADVSGCESGLA